MNNRKNQATRLMKLLAVILLSLFIVQCEFESNETWYNDISEPEAELATAELNFKDSIIYIDQPTTFEYTLNFLKQEVYQVAFYIDKYKFETRLEPDGSVLVDPSPGIHQFRMEVYTSTESGSIADEIGREAFTYSQSWTIYSETVRDAQIQINTIEQTEESLLIEWDQYQGYMFKSYELFKKTSKGDILLCESLDVDQTSFFDPYYVGGSVNYFVRLNKNNGDLFESDTNSYYTCPGSMEFDLDWEQHYLTIHWPKCQFGSNFQLYRVKQKVNGGSAEQIYSTEELNDTSLTIPVGENQNLQYEVVYVTKMPDSDPENGEYTISSENCSTGPFYFPKKFPAYEIIVQSKRTPCRIYTPEFYYYVLEDTLHYRSYCENNGLFDVSDDAGEHISGTSLYHGDGDGWTHFGILNELSNIPSTVFENDDRRACISNHSILLIESGSTSYLFDTRDNAIIYQYDNNSLYWPVLSPQGQYIISSDVEKEEIYCYYSYWGGSTGRVWCVDLMKTLNGTAGNYVFRNNVEFAMIEGSRLELRSVVEMRPDNGNGDGLLLSAETTATRVVETDPISNTLLACSSEHLFVYDLNDLRLMGKIPNTAVYQSVIQRGSQQVAYLNSTVFFIEEGAEEATRQLLPIDKWR